MDQTHSDGFGMRGGGLRVPQLRAVDTEVDCGKGERGKRGEATMTQPHLFALKDHATAGGHAARRMIALMAKRPGWWTRAQFSEFMLTDRECRAGRKASHGRIIYGQRGYCLLRDAMPDEIRACLATTASMIRELQEEYRQTARRAHGVLNGTEAVK